MELRVLQYFLAVAREQSISGAAAFLHLTQPTLSRQLHELEEELGKQLFVRGNRKITLTEDGMLLRRRAEEIVELVRKTESEISLSEETICGDVHIGTGETDAMRLIARVARHLQAAYPQVRFHIVSDDASDVTERLDKGLIDFGVLIGNVDISKYDYMPIPAQDSWGVLMRRDSRLASEDSIRPEMLWDKPIILSRQVRDGREVAAWLGKSVSALHVVATYNLVYNASLMVDEGLGYALTLEKLINTTGDSNLCFLPFDPPLRVGLNIVWKKYQVFSKASEKFLKMLRTEFADAT